MSKPPLPMNGPHRHTSPSFGRGVFDRFTTYFGNQKMAAMWGTGDSLERSIAEWNDALQATHPTLIGAALQRVRESGSDWPPALPAFLAMVRDVDHEAAMRLKGMQGKLQIGTDAYIAPASSQAVQAFRSQLGRLAHAKMTAPIRARPRAERAESQAVRKARDESPGLPGLLGLCAQAMALAGTDEAQAMRDIERRVAE